jgi:hypothetical protein
MLWLKESNRIRVSKIVKVAEKYATVFGSSSSKKQDGSYEYSNWTITFLGKARAAFDMISEGSVITITSGGIDNIPYENKDGDKVWQNVKVKVFDFEVYRVGSGAGSSEGTEVPDEDDIPF